MAPVIFVHCLQRFHLLNHPLLVLSNSFSPGNILLLVELKFEEEPNKQRDGGTSYGYSNDDSTDFRHLFNWERLALYNFNNSCVLGCCWGCGRAPITIQLKSTTEDPDFAQEDSIPLHAKFCHGSCDSTTLKCGLRLKEKDQETTY
jgi:hypothetical protein